MGAVQAETQCGVHIRSPPIPIGLTPRGAVRFRIADRGMLTTGADLNSGHLRRLDLN